MTRDTYERTHDRKFVLFGQSRKTGILDVRVHDRTREGEVSPEKVYVDEYLRRGSWKRFSEE